MLTIGIVGVKTSGKSTAANIIKDFFLSTQKPVFETAFAEKIKQTCSKTFILPKNLFDDQRYKEKTFNRYVTPILTKEKIETILKAYNLDSSQVEKEYGHLLNKRLQTPREIAVVVGTEILRKKDENIHLKNMLLKKDNINIVSDLRFANEYNYLKKIPNFLCFYINRIEAEKKINKNSHISETELFSFCHECILINNNSDVDSLKRQIVNILERKFYV
jgi:hypothetical protein